MKKTLEQEMKKFDEQHARSRKLAFVRWIVSGIVSLVIWMGIAFVVYKLLVHFGIAG